MSEKLQEAVEKLIPALEAVEGANALLTRIKEEVKEDLGLNPSAVIYGIKRAMKKKLNQMILNFKMIYMKKSGKMN